MTDYTAILEANAVPMTLREPVIALARLLSDCEVRRTKREIVEFLGRHADVPPVDLSLAIARSIHSNSPLALDAAQIASVNQTPKLQ